MNKFDCRLPGNGFKEVLEMPSMLFQNIESISRNFDKSLTSEVQKIATYPNNLNDIYFGGARIWGPDLQSLFRLARIKSIAIRAKPCNFCVMWMRPV